MEEIHQHSKHLLTIMLPTIQEIGGHGVTLKHPDKIPRIESTRLRLL